MTNVIGFIALIVAIFALSKKDIITLRWWHLWSSSIYIIYGVIISAPPVIVGALLYCGIHSWHIYKDFQKKRFKRDN